MESTTIDYFAGGGGDLDRVFQRAGIIACSSAEASL